MTNDRLNRNDEIKRRHSERSRGIPWNHFKAAQRDPSTPLRFAQDDCVSVILVSSLIRHSPFVLRHSST
jgi:hypothetical protein